MKKLILAAILVSLALPSFARGGHGGGHHNHKTTATPHTFKL